MWQIIKIHPLTEEEKPVRGTAKHTYKEIVELISKRGKKHEYPKKVVANPFKKAV